MDEQKKDIAEQASASEDTALISEQTPLSETELLISQDTAAETDPAAPKTKKKRRWWQRLLLVLLILLLVLLVLALSIYLIVRGFIHDNVNQATEYNASEVDARPDKDISQDIADELEDPSQGDITDIQDAVRNVHNIALFGLDQEEGSVGRSDTMIILSVDRENGKIKLTSLARDSLVPIEGHGEEKLTHSWAYGHAKLALKTINQAYGMNITDYVYVNFEEFTEVIDFIGGVKVHVNALELSVVNYTTDQSQKLPGTGTHLLNGEQALRYARCRKDSDKNRTARQREVLIAMYEQVRSQPIAKLPDTLKKVLQLCHTTLTADEIMDIALWAITDPPTIETLSLPNSQLKPWSGNLDKAGWVWVYDLEAAKKVLYNFIYEQDMKVSDVTQYVPATTTAPPEQGTTTTVTP